MRIVKRAAAFTAAAVLMLMSAVLVPSHISAGSADITTSGEQTVEELLEENVNSQLSALDTGIFDKFIYSLDERSHKIFSAATFGDKLRTVVSGGLSTDYEGVFGVALAVFFDEALGLLPVLASICALAIFSSLLSFAKADGSKSGDTLHFVCYIAIVLVVLNVIFQLVTGLTAAIDTITQFMSLVFPLILTLMTASGSAVSGGIYQPAVALLCSSVAGIFSAVIVPLFTASIILNVVANFTDNVRVAKFAGVFKSTGQWITGIAFTVFLAFLSIQGIQASTYDSVSVRAVKYAIGNSVPIVGGYIKDGFNLILGSTVLIKNAVGVTGLLLLLSYVIAPVINILVCILGFKLAAAVIEPLSDAKTPNFLHSVSQSFGLLMAAFLAIAFMFFVTVMLMIMTTNSVLL